jgi:hypothetical protein
MSFNAPSVTPPLPLPKSKLNATTTTNQLPTANTQAQLPFFHSFQNQFEQQQQPYQKQQQQQWMSGSSGLMDLAQHQAFMNVPPSSLNDSLASHFLGKSSNDLQQRFVSANLHSAGFQHANAFQLSNPAELSPFNMQKFTQHTTTTTVSSNASYSNVDAASMTNLKSNLSAANAVYNNQVLSGNSKQGDSFNDDESFKFASNLGGRFLSAANNNNNNINNINNNQTSPDAILNRITSNLDDLEFEYLNKTVNSSSNNSNGGSSSSGGGKPAPAASSSSLVGGLSLVHNIDNHHHNMLKFYEEEEKNIEFEIKQDEKLLYVLAEEAKLTRQLSVEQLNYFTHFNQQYQHKNKTSKTSPFKKSMVNDDNEMVSVCVELDCSWQIFLIIILF